MWAAPTPHHVAAAQLADEVCVFVRLFVDVRNGEPIPRKSILKSRSRENSVCSDTSESSAADFEERRVMGRSFSHDEATHSDTSDGITEEDSPTAVPPLSSSRFEVSVDAPRRLISLSTVVQMTCR